MIMTSMLPVADLNEVLSIRAQEWRRMDDDAGSEHTSMKS